MPAPVDEVQDLPRLPPAGHPEVLEAVAVLRGVPAALRDWAWVLRDALTVFVEPDGWGQGYKIDKHRVGRLPFFLH